MIWGQQQADALSKVGRWHSQCMSELASGTALSQPIFRLFGFAGTGKTTLAKHLAAGTDGNTVFGAYTGKAALVMRRNGCDGAQTLHSAVYVAEANEETNEITFTWAEDGPFSRADLICIDECSMCDEAMALDILKYGRPILALGDPAQLPPVKGAGYFTSAEPDAMLTEIHRQAEGNPIIAMATAIREGRGLAFGDYGESSVIPVKSINAGMALGADQILVGVNTTREKYNRRIRELLRRTNILPEVGDKLICTKNDRPHGLFNGGIYRVAKTFPPKVGRNADGEIRLIIESTDIQDAAPMKVYARNECFRGTLDVLPWQARKGLQEFAYGYAITTHKAQGSQWDDVLILDQSSTFGHHADRWLYTAITRAAHRVRICR
jgi:exodeoxyribonuclease-5